MIVIVNKIFPPAGFKALTLWPLLLVRSKYMTERDMRHEEIHGCQQRELLLVGVAACVVSLAVGWGWWSLLWLPLYLWVYGGLWMYGYVGTKDVDRAYRENPLEREAYFFEGDAGYLERRRWFAWKQFVK